MTTGTILAIGAGVVVLGGAIFFAVNSGAKAAAAQQAATAAAAARAAANAKSTSDVANVLANMGGDLLSEAWTTITKGITGSNGAKDAAAGVLV